VPDLVVLVLAATGTAVATGIGALPVALLGAARVERLRPLLAGLSAGCMAVASVAGLLEPGLDRGVASVLAGAVAGVAFLLVVRDRVGHPRDGRAGRRWLVVALVLFAHSLPEGLAMGTAYGSGVAGLGLFVILAIALQNVPEGTATALPMQEAGMSGAAQVWTAIATSLPQPVGAVVAYLAVEAVTALLPFSFGFAAGAMAALVALELAPGSLSRPVLGASGWILGGAAMLALARVAGV